MKNEPAAALVDSTIRRPLMLTTQRSLPNVSFIAYNEIPSDLLIEPVSIIHYQDVFGNEPVGEPSMAAAAPEEVNS